ncbi:hypothetical protein EBA42_RS15900, partial [Escherichia coli]
MTVTTPTSVSDGDELLLCVLSQPDKSSIATTDVAIYFIIFSRVRNTLLIKINEDMSGIFSYNEPASRNEFRNEIRGINIPRYW